MQPRVFCLGGGNFDPGNLEASYLINVLKFTLPEVIEAQLADCNKLRLQSDGWNVDHAR